MNKPEEKTSETQRQPKGELTPELREQLEAGRRFMKEFEETFRALART